MTTTSNENILMMFEEINEKLDRTNRQIEKIGLKQPEAIDNTEIAELKSAIENSLENQSEKLESLKILVQKEKRKIEFTPTSTFGMVFFLSLMIILMALVVWNNSLRNQNASLSDNDLKFRYIQMQGNTAAKDFAELDSLFHFNRNSKKIKALRNNVEAFEENVKQRARILEQEERLRKQRTQLEKKMRKP